MLVNGRGYAIVEAGANPIEFDYELSSIARADFGGTLQGGFTAHPKGDPATGELGFGGWLWRYDLATTGPSRTTVTLTYADTHIIA